MPNPKGFKPNMQNAAHPDDMPRHILLIALIIRKFYQNGNRDKAYPLKENQKLIESWLNTSPNWRQRQLSRILFFWHHKTGLTLSPLSVVRWLLKLLLATTGPALLYKVYGRISLNEAYTATAIIAVVFILHDAIDRLVLLRQQHKQQRLIVTEVWVRIGDLIASIKSSATPKHNQDDTITATLGIVEGVARQITNCNKGEISVSLLKYTGKSTSKMKIRHRNPGNERPKGRTINDLSNLLGHHACQANSGPKIVADLKQFHASTRQSPTQGKSCYRSIAIFPLKSASTDKVFGFLSVDCTKPHAFHGDRAAELVVTCEPLISHIQDLH